jgi:hypothetical protein
MAKSDAVKETTLKDVMDFIQSQDRDANLALNKFLVSHINATRRMARSTAAAEKRPTLMAGTVCWSKFKDGYYYPTYITKINHTRAVGYYWEDASTMEVAYTIPFSLMEHQLSINLNDTDENIIAAMKEFIGRPECKKHALEMPYDPAYFIMSARNQASGMYN